MQKKQILYIVIVLVLIFLLFIAGMIHLGKKGQEEKYGTINIEERENQSIINNRELYEKNKGIKENEEDKKDSLIDDYNKLLNDERLQIISVPENQSFQNITDKDGFEYEYSTFNESALAVPIPKNFNNKQGGSISYFKANGKEEENKGIEISIRSKWINRKIYSGKAPEYIFSLDLFDKLRFHDLEESYIPAPDNLGNREYIYDGEKIIGTTISAKDANFILEKNPVMKKNGFLRWSFLLVDDRAIQITVMGPNAKEKRIEEINKTLVDNIKRNKITNYRFKKIDKTYENKNFSIGYSSEFKVQPQIFDEDRVKFVIGDNPIEPDYFMQVFVGTFSKEKMHRKGNMTIQDLRSSDIFDEIKDYLYLSSKPQDTDKSYYQMHNYFKKNVVINGKIATESQFNILYDNIGLDTDELADGTAFTVYLFEKDEKNIGVLMFNYSDFQKKIAFRYIDEITKTFILK